MITFLTSGLWHGASWTYVIWGALHGMVQVIENHINIQKKSKLAKLISWVVVFVFCNLAWVFFRADTLKGALTVIFNMIGGLKNPSMYFYNCIVLDISSRNKIFVTILLLFVYDYASLKVDVIEWLGKQKVCLRWLLYIVVVFQIIINVQTNNETAFIYFQF
jgi:hypothetical protein